MQLASPTLDIAQQSRRRLYWHAPRLGACSAGMLRGPGETQACPGPAVHCAVHSLAVRLEGVAQAVADLIHDLHARTQTLFITRLHGRAMHLLGKHMCAPPQAELPC